MVPQINLSRQSTIPTNPNQLVAEDAVWRAVTRGNDGAVQGVLEDKKNGDYKDRLVNTVRSLEDGDIRDGDSRGDYMTGEYSVLFIAIYRNLDKDAKYLIQQRNIKLTTRCGYDQRTVLFEAVLREKHDIVLQLLRCPSISPSQHVNIGDRWSFTPLHQIAMNCSFSDEMPLEFGKDQNTESNNSKNLKELLIHGANTDALNQEFRTPLHVLASRLMNKEAMRCVGHLLNARAEVNTKDELGDSPLHEACKNRDRHLIKRLLAHGADLDSRNLYWMTPQDLFYQWRQRPLSEEDHKFAKTEFLAIKKSKMARRGIGNVPTQPEQCPEEMRNVCGEFPVYLRYHWPGLDAKADENNSISWVRTDMKVSEILYFRDSDVRSHFEAFKGGPRFLADCDSRFVDRILQSPEAYTARLENDGQNSEMDKEGQERRKQNAKKIVGESVKKSGWRWINFPANNMTWIKDFIIHNAKYKDRDQVDRRIWQFFENSIRVRETNTPNSRVRIPHVYATRRSDSQQTTKPRRKREQRKKISTETSNLEFGTEKPPAQNTEEEKSSRPDNAASWSDSDGFEKSGSMLSLVVPFLDIETEDQTNQDNGGFTTQCERIKKLNDAYFPFTGMHGVQRSQTLDQTSYNIQGDEGNLRSEKNQVIYRWSKKRNEERELYRRRQGPTRRQSQLHVQNIVTATKEQWERDSSSTNLVTNEKTPGPGFLESLLAFMKPSPATEKAQGAQIIRRRTLLGTQHDSIREERAGRLGASAPNAEMVRQDPTPKWLMVRQLWLWKLDDNTILTAIPSRQNGMTADTLMETIRQGNLDALRTPEDLIKRILYEAVSFLDEFKWAGLGEHILDIFQGEIAYETDQEAKFYENFTKSDWSPRAVNETVQAAAKSTWRVKDIRDELRLLRQVFETQLKVVEEFADKFWPSKIPDGTNHDKSSWRSLRESFIRDSSLRNMIERVKRMDEDASTTLDGLSNIIQAMQAQASLKEAEAARVMNLIILPFTIVTVIFTPLSFLTSLFAVNTLNFPHNDDGELRLPGTWFSWRMVVGELGSLIPLLLLVGLIYYRQVTGSYWKSTKRPKDGGDEIR